MQHAVKFVCFPCCGVRAVEFVYICVQTHESMNPEWKFVGHFTLRLTRICIRGSIVELNLIIIFSKIHSRWNTHALRANTIPIFLIITVWHGIFSGLLLKLRMTRHKIHVWCMFRSILGMQTKCDSFVIRFWSNHMHVCVLSCAVNFGVSLVATQNVLFGAVIQN